VTGRGVLHGAGVELGHEQLVVLAEGVPVAEHPVVEVEALLGDREQVVGLQVLHQRAAAVDAERDAVVLVVHRGVRTGDQRGDVGRDARRLGEGPGAGLALGGAGLHGAVADDHPVPGGVHDQAEHRLEVGLVEAGVHPVGVEGLELRVEVDRAVDRVDEAVQALTGAHVDGVGLHDQLVVVGQPVELDAVAVEGGHGIDRLAVQHDRADRTGGQVEVRGCARLGAREADGRAAPEGPLTGSAGAVGEVELHVVGRHGEQAGALGGLVPGEGVGGRGGGRRGGGHPPHPSTQGRRPRAGAARADEGSRSCRSGGRSTSLRSGDA
jgi:hypothetical protein